MSAPDPTLVEQHAAKLATFGQKIDDIEKMVASNTEKVATLASLATKTPAAQALTIQSLPDGLKTTMTRGQHILHIVAGVLQVVFLLVSLALYFVPSLGESSIVGGVTLVALISGIKNIINPFLANYGDANIPIEVASAAPAAPPVIPSS
jgi:hypothetical protein